MQPVREIHPQSRADRSVLQIVQIDTVAGIPAIAVAINELPGDSEGQGIVDRGQLDGASHGALVELAIAGLERAAETAVVGKLCGDLNGTAGGVAPVQGSLRSLENFDLGDALEVVQT